MWAKENEWKKWHKRMPPTRYGDTIHLSKYSECGMFLSVYFIVERDEDDVPDEDKCKRCLKSMNKKK